MSNTAQNTAGPDGAPPAPREPEGPTEVQRRILLDFADDTRTRHTRSTSAEWAEEGPALLEAGWIARSAAVGHAHYLTDAGREALKRTEGR